MHTADIEYFHDDLRLVGHLAVDDAKPGEASRMARFPGRFIEWRGALADGWSVAGVLDRSTTDERAPRAAARPAPLSKDAYRRRRQVVEDDLTRLGLRKSQLELALGDPKVQANFVELRRVTSELADVDQALAAAEEAWLLLEERAP